MYGWNEDGLDKCWTCGLQIYQEGQHRTDSKAPPGLLEHSSDAQPFLELELAHVVLELAHVVLELAQATLRQKHSSYIQATERGSPDM